MEYIDATAPLTQEQWDRVMAWGKLRFSKDGQAAPQSARTFSESIQQLQAQAGCTSEQLSGLQGALLDMANQEDQ